MDRKRATSLAIGIFLGLPWTAVGNPAPPRELNPVVGKKVLDKYPQHAERIQAKADALGLSLDYDQRPTVTKRTSLQYPQRAFITKTEGTVLVMFVIDETGRVTNAEALESVAGLDDAALAYVAGWEFKPAKKDGQPTGTVAVLEIEFVIR